MRSLRPRMKTMTPFSTAIVRHNIQEVILQIYILFMISLSMSVIFLIILLHIKFHDYRVVAQWMWNRESEWHQFEYPT